MPKSTTKHLNYTKKKIKHYIEILKTLIRLDRFKISDINRDKNLHFINEYHLTPKKQKEMLNNLEVEDFCYAVDDYNSKDRLYIFSKDYELDNWGIYKTVSVYIKININKIKNAEYALIISFHEREKNINFLFKRK